MKIIKIHMSVSPAFVDDQYQHEFDCSPRDNIVILFKVIYSLHISITPCTYYGLGFLKSEIMKALDLEITGAWKNVGTMHWLLGEYGTGITLFHLLYLLDHVLHKLIILWSCH